MPTVTVPRLRERFPILRDATYLVSHSMGAAPTGARAALGRYADAWEARGPEAWSAWLPELARIADGIGALFGAPPGTVSLVPNVSHAMAALASSTDFRAHRNEVAIEALQFPSVGYVWHAWERYGARVVTVPSVDGRTTSTDALCSAITERTAFAVLSHAAYQSGATIDVAAIATRARETGTVFVLDAYQTAGAVPFDVTRLGLDVVVGGSHKWLCGGPGCGFVYVRHGLRERFAPATTGWMAHADPFAFADPPIELATGAERYYTGTPTVPGFLVAKPGHDAIAEIGVAAIREHNVRLTDALAEGALARGFTVPTPLDPARRTGWIGMDFPGADRATAALVGRRVFVDYRPGCGIRVGPHFYSTDDDVRTFFSELDAVRPR